VWKKATRRSEIGAICLIVATLGIGAAVIASATGNAGTPIDPTPTPQTVMIGPEPTFRPGLPIDTPPSTDSTVYTSPPSGSEARWADVEKWAWDRCGIGGGSPSTTPLMTIQTTAGELRRGVAAERGDGSNILGSDWRNTDRLFVVVFGGGYSVDPGPPAGMDEPTQNAASLTANACIYIGNGNTDVSDNAQIEVTTFRQAPNTAQDVWRALN